jgi:hypothetical protein
VLCATLGKELLHEIMQIKRLEHFLTFDKGGDVECTMAETPPLCLYTVTADAAPGHCHGSSKRGARFHDM